MIAIKCPACGAEGRAPNDKVLTRLVCKKCLRVFHVTPSGKSVLGEPPGTGQTSLAQSRVAPDRTLEVDQWFARAWKRFSSPTSLILTAGLILLAVVAASFSSWRPESLQDRVARAARAAVQGDLKTIEELAATGTDTYMGPWYVSIRPQSDELLQRLGSSKLAVETEVKQQDSGQGGVEVIAWVSTSEDLERKGRALPDPTIVAASANPLPISLPMFWKYEGWGGWRLDLKRSLELSKAAS